ncbi:hypothetical protein BDBG_17799 [Blastomyces gilchristii SLH14081]|uniref:Uncharacterized protein n=1 Tax=Blastomyces gilchristii (strain SLH14081) TaxID=559298 RepID=A0A179UZZ0_BLAGS|nr:uncharacterized protein BDBG_17799 [Blastomyces gilchristii SLH14081]OAT13410.1 hypothetical protein BDBG_17799 [Blastomyces gilchristii SLH14081]
MQCLLLVGLVKRSHTLSFEEKGHSNKKKQVAMHLFYFSTVLKYTRPIYKSHGRAWLWFWAEDRHGQLLKVKKGWTYWRAISRNHKTLLFSASPKAFGARDIRSTLMPSA